MESFEGGSIVGVAGCCPRAAVMKMALIKIVACLGLIGTNPSNNYQAFP
jgi:hypothetical protein